MIDRHCESHTHTCWSIQLAAWRYLAFLILLSLETKEELATGCFPIAPIICDIKGPFIPHHWREEGPHHWPRIEVTHIPPETGLTPTEQEGVPTASLRKNSSYIDWMQWWCLLTLIHHLSFIRHTHSSHTSTLDLDPRTRPRTLPWNRPYTEEP